MSQWTFGENPVPAGKLTQKPFLTLRLQVLIEAGAEYVRGPVIEFLALFGAPCAAVGFSQD